MTVNSADQKETSTSSSTKPSVEKKHVKSTRKFDLYYNALRGFMLLVVFAGSIFIFLHMQNNFLFINRSVIELGPGQYTLVKKEYLQTVYLEKKFFMNVLNNQNSSIKSISGARSAIEDHILQANKRRTNQNLDQFVQCNLTVFTKAYGWFNGHCVFSNTSDVTFWGSTMSSVRAIAQESSKFEEVLLAFEVPKMDSTKMQAKQPLELLDRLYKRIWVIGEGIFHELDGTWTAQETVIVNRLNNILETTTKKHKLWRIYGKTEKSPILEGTVLGYRQKNFITNGVRVKKLYQSGYVRTMLTQKGVECNRVHVSDSFMSANTGRIVPTVHIIGLIVLFYKLQLHRVISDYVEIATRLGVFNVYALVYSYYGVYSLFSVSSIDKSVPVSVVVYILCYEIPSLFISMDALQFVIVKMLVATSRGSNLYLHCRISTCICMLIIIGNVIWRLNFTNASNYTYGTLGCSKEYASCYTSHDVVLYSASVLSCIIVGIRSLLHVQNHHSSISSTKIQKLNSFEKKCVGCLVNSCITDEKYVQDCDTEKCQIEGMLWLGFVPMKSGIMLRLKDCVLGVVRYLLPAHMLRNMNLSVVTWKWKGNHLNGGRQIRLELINKKKIVSVIQDEN